MRDAGPDGTADMDGSADAPADVSIVPPPDGSLQHPCDLPGSIQFLQTGTHTVAGGSPTAPSLAFLHLPPGFCAHYFGTVGNARQLRFAPGGELFVASPTTLTTGGGANGQSAIVLLADDDQDGLADAPVTFLTGLPSTQGLLFTPGFFYYQDSTRIMRMPYATGQRTPIPNPAQVADINMPADYVSGLHWPKTLDMADDGSIYVGNGGDQGETCVTPHPFHGGIFKIDPAPGGPNPNGIPFTKGFRNPINVRCASGHNQCFALELALDYSAGQGGREKMIPIRQGDDWGFPCCASTDLPYSTSPGANCSGVAADTNSFYIGDTPFGVDFELGQWPAPWTRNAFVVTHGAAGTWSGARMVSIPMDPATGLPEPSTNMFDGGNVGMVDFATGWHTCDPATQVCTNGHGRPAALAFAADGRLFVANDTDGTIFWIAPLDM
jgi:glucose/arabinose dehydrogenase